MRKTHVTILALLLSFCLLCGLLPTAVAFADDDKDTRPYNIVLLIDRSGSMNVNDKEQRTVDCAKMFVGSLFHYNYVNQARGAGLNHTSIGVVSFSSKGEVLTVPVDVSSQAGVNQVKSYIDSIEYERLYEGSTNLGEAVNSAVQLLKAVQDKDHRNMIVLFTDGYNDGLSAVQTKKANALLADALQEANNMDCEIYTVGFDPQHAYNAEGKAAIRSISNTTQKGIGVTLPDAGDNSGHDRVNSVITDSVKGVKDFYTSIICDIIGDADTVQIYDGVIDLSQPGIVFATLFVYSDEEQITDLHLFNPRGEEVPLGQGDVLLDVGDSYTLISIGTPDPGVWKLESTNLFKYDVSLMIITAVTPDILVNTSGNSGSVSFTCSNDGEVQGQSFYDHLAMFRCDILDDAGNVVTEVPLTFNSANSAQEGRFQVDKPGTYSAVVTMALSNYIERQTAVSFDMSYPANPIRVSVKNRFSENVDLQQTYAPGWSTAGIVFDRAEVNEQKIASVSSASGGREITVKGMNVGQSDFTVYAHDAFGNQLQIPGSVDVSFNVLIYVPYMIAAAALLIALIAFLIWWKNRPYFKGFLEIALTMPESLRDKTPTPTTFDLSTLQTQDPRTLFDLFDKQFTVGNQYSNALNFIRDYLLPILMLPQRSQTLCLKIPKPKTGVTLSLDGNSISKARKVLLADGMLHQLTIGSESGAYELALTFKEDTNNNSFSNLGGNSGLGGLGGDGGFGEFGGLGSDGGNTGFGDFGNFGDAGKGKGDSPFSGFGGNSGADAGKGKGDNPFSGFGGSSSTDAGKGNGSSPFGGFDL